MKSKGTEKINCDKCEYTSGSKTLMERHMNTAHREEQHISPEKTKQTVTLPQTKYTSKRLKCDQCPKQFNKKETYQKHTNTVHQNDFQCYQCEKQIHPKRNLPTAY